MRKDLRTINTKLMVQIANQIEKCFEDNSTTQTIFKSIWFRILIFTPYIFIGSSFVISIFYTDVLKHVVSFILFILAFTIFILFFYITINLYAKKQLLNLGITSKNKLLSGWQNKEYNVYIINKLINCLHKEGILIKEDHHKNQILLQEYANFFKIQSDKINYYKELAIIGSLLVLSFAPAWNIITENLITSLTYVDKKIIITLSVLTLSIIFSLIMIIFFFRIIFQIIFESRKRRLNNISNSLLNIKWNLILNEK